MENRKKVVLWNTHLDNIINAPDELIDRLSMILDIFIKHSEIILLWRPHPLSIETIKSMRPLLLCKYISLVEKAKRENNIIYDDTMDVDRAIAVADAYIGDKSSMVMLCRYRNIPILVLDELNSFYEKPVNFLAGGLLDNTIYFASHDSNAFMKLDLEHAEIKCIGRFPVPAGIQLFRNACLVGRILWFIPGRALDIVKVNLDDFSMESFRISQNKYLVEEGRMYYLSSLRIDNQLWLFPGMADNIAIFDMQKGSFSFIPLPGDYGCSYKEEYKFRTVVLCGDWIWLVPETGSRITLLNRFTYEFQSISLGFSMKKDSYESAVYDGNAVWLVPSEADDFILIDEHDRAVKRLRILPEEMEKITNKFTYCCFRKGKIWLFSYDNDIIMTVDPQMEKIDKVYLWSQKERGCYFNLIANEGYILPCSSSKKTLHLLDEVRDIIVDYNMVMEREDKEYMLSGEIEAFINYVCNMKRDLGEKYSRQQIGQKIWLRVKGSL